MPGKFEKLEKNLDYHFQKTEILELALTHRSVANVNNERLEFLGDSLVNFIIAAYLYEHFPHLTEGQLSRLRANLINGEILAEIAKELEIGDYLYLGIGELRSGGKRRRSILANSLEAMIGAIYLDGGLLTCRDVVLKWYAKRFQEVEKIGVRKDPKTILQEQLQANKLSLPIYRTAQVKGKAHAQTFHIKCEVKELNLVGEGVGTSKRKAEQAAAEYLLKLLEQQNDTT